MSRPRPGPPPLRPFGLRLHRDGSWTHEGVAVTHPRLRRALDRGVRFLPEERKFVVQLGRFRGQIEVEEAPFFVLGFDAESGAVRLSDGSVEPLDPDTLHPSPWDGAVRCRVKRGCVSEGLLARFTPAAQASLWLAVEETGEGLRLRVADRLCALPRDLTDTEPPTRP